MFNWCALKCTRLSGKAILIAGAFSKICHAIAVLFTLVTIVLKANEILICRKKLSSWELKGAQALSRSPLKCIEKVL